MVVLIITPPFFVVTDIARISLADARKILAIQPEKEMGDSASPRAAAAAPCGFTLCFFVLAIFEGGS